MKIARMGSRVWNQWRAANLRVQPDLTRIDLSNRDLRACDFRGVGLFKANLSHANLRGAILRQAIMIKTDLRGADLTGAYVYGASVWDIRTDQSTIQRDLVVTDPYPSGRSRLRRPEVTVDDLEMAQFVHLMITTRKLRQIIETFTSKVVLILGRFTAPRKRVLDKLKHLVRGRNLLPVIFDFHGPRSRDTTETVRTLAHLARFVIVDLTSPRSVPHELASFVPLLEVPVAPIIAARSREYSMFEDYRRKYSWVLETFRYKSLDHLAKVGFPQILASVAKTKRPARRC